MKPLILKILEKWTKQNPVAELSEFCYTWLLKVTEEVIQSEFVERITQSVVYRFVARRIQFPTQSVFLGLKASSSFVFLSTYPTFLFRKFLTYITWCIHLFFNERSARSESIISNLTSDVKNSVLNSHFQRLNKAIKKGIMSQIEQFLIGKNNFVIALLGKKRLAMMKFYEIDNRLLTPQ